MDAARDDVPRSRAPYGPRSRPWPGTGAQQATRFNARLWIFFEGGPGDRVAFGHFVGVVLRAPL